MKSDVTYGRGRTKKRKPKPKSSWTGWGVVLGGRDLRCVFDRAELDLAENEADRYLDAEVVRVKVTRLAKKKRRSATRARVRRSAAVRRGRVNRRNRSEDS